MTVLRLSAGRTVAWPAPAVAVGNFDGVHLGHQALVAAALDEARAAGGTPAVLTFDPHPARVLQPGRAPGALMTLEQKTEALAALGIHHVAVLEFTAALAARSASEFARGVLAGTLAARAVVVGADFRFGRGREGDVPALSALGGELGFGVRVVPPVMRGSEPVSSTRVRDALGAGEVEEAAALLGRDYAVDGEVVVGDRRGRTLGFPTANLEPVNELLPARGVYACRCRLPGGEERPAAVNIGRRPTFDGERTTVEAHLIDFAGDLYGARLRLSFVQRLREEARFAGLEALRAQIAADVARARAVLRGPSRR
ncbi:MAG TPA: bifunctional riboflavin kinase/FAD synthetase [Vicinamibacteria bacterium]|nr:bifunctional riboflavin kinase/FAD synthetase [Vicinamibacteria bacterium]